MDIITSKIDIHSDAYKQNFEAMDALVKDLQHELKRAREERSKKAMDRLIESGKLTAQKKLDLLLDKNTPFLEIAPLAARDMYDGKVHAAGLRTGIGVVAGWKFTRTNASGIIAPPGGSLLLGMPSSLAAPGARRCGASTS